MRSEEEVPDWSFVSLEVLENFGRNLGVHFFSARLGLHRLLVGDCWWRTAVGSVNSICELVVFGCHGKMYSGLFIYCYGHGVLYVVAL